MAFWELEIKEMQNEPYVSNPVEVSIWSRK